MAANYTLDELRVQQSRIVEDLKQLRVWWQSNISAGSINAEVTLMIDNNSWTAAEMSRIITSEYFNIPSFGLVDSGTKRKAKSLISRLKSHYTYLVEYERREKERKEKDKINQVKDPKEKKILKNVEKKKIEANSLLYKTPEQIAGEYAIRIDENVTKAIYDFETRWNNNDQKVGNVFVSNYQNLKDEFANFVKDAEKQSPYSSIATYYNQYAAKYGFGDLVKDSLECLVSNTPLATVRAAIDEVQKEIDDFIKDADAVITESLNIVDQSIGIAEEVYDASKEIDKELKDYKARLEDVDIPTEQDAVRNKYREQFLRVLLPALTKQVSDVLQAVVNGLCEQNEVAVYDLSSILPEQGLADKLRDTYGIGPATLQDYLAMLMDISSVLTPVEICQLFNDEASDITVDLVVNFIAEFYRKIYPRMNTRQRVRNFFVLIGDLTTFNFCKEIDLGDFNETFCGGGDDEYSKQLRNCLIKRDPSLAQQTRAKFLDKKKKDIKAALKLAYFPMDLRADQKEIDKVFEELQKQQIASPLIKLAMEYKSKYKEALSNMSQYFVANFQINDEKGGFVEENLFRVRESLGESFDEVAPAIPSSVPRFEKQILPDIYHSLFLDKSNVSVVGNGDSIKISKMLQHDRTSQGNLKNIVNNIINMKKSGEGINEDKLFFNQELVEPNYVRIINHEYEKPSGGSQKSKALYNYETEFYYSSGKNEDPLKVSLINRADLQDYNINYTEANSYNTLLKGSDTYLRKITNDNVGDVFKGGFDTLYKNGFQANYNKLVNICMNSVFAKKISIGKASSGDSGKISGLELINLSPDLPCVDRLNLNFDLINFENLARQIANLDITEFKPDVVDEALEREKFFTNLMMFKTNVLDFVIKSIFLFSEFDFEESDVDDMMVDFVYVQFFREMLRKDFELEKTNLEFMNLSTKDMQDFIKNTYWEKYEAQESYKNITSSSDSKIRAIIDEIKEKIDTAKKNKLNFINITYDVAQTLKFFYNNNNPNNKTESYCEAIRILIRKEISNLSKALKDIVYTDKQKQAKTFNIEERFLEKKLNILPYNVHKKIGFQKITDNDFTLYIDAAVENFCNQIPTYHHTYFRPTKEGDDYVYNSKLADAVQSQMGGDAFLLTRFTEFDLTSKKAEVEIVSCFFNNSINESAGVVTKDFNWRRVDENVLVKSFYNADPENPQPSSPGFSPKQVNKDVETIADEMFGPTYDGDRIIILGLLANTNLLKAYPKIEDRINKAFGDKKINKILYGKYVVDQSKKRSPFHVVAIRDQFNRIYENVSGWGTLRQSLKSEMYNDEIRQISYDILKSAEDFVNTFRGESAKIIKFSTAGQVVEDFSLEESAKRGYRKEEANRIVHAKKDTLYKNNYRYMTFGSYPYTPLSQFYRRATDSILTDDYKHRGGDSDKDNTAQQPPVFTEVSKYSLIKNINNQFILDIFKKARQRMTPDSISLIGEFRRRKVYYNKTPIATISLDLSNYNDFVTNFRNEYSKTPSVQEYIDVCLKPQIIAEFKNKNIITDEYYKNSFPLKKMLSHIACNMNNYVEMINNVEPQTGRVQSKRIVTMRSLEDASLFNIQSLTALSAGLTGLSVAQAQSIARSNANLSAADIISMTNSFDFTTYFIKTSIKNYLSIIEQSDLNIKISKSQANLIGNALRQIYSKATKIADSANKIGAIFGADTAGQGLPSQQQLVQDFRGLKLLFNPPTTPFAIGNFLAGIPPTSGFVNWIAYLILEPLLLAIELSEDAGLLEELKNALFDGDNDNSFAASEKNILEACEIERARRLTANPIDKKNQKTSGGEYLLPDGREYVGEYHIHKDGTVMVGGDHPKDQPTIVLTRVLKRDDL